MVCVCVCVLSSDMDAPAPPQLVLEERQAVLARRTLGRLVENYVESAVLNPETEGLGVEVGWFVVPLSPTVLRPGWGEGVASVGWWGLRVCCWLCGVWCCAVVCSFSMPKPCCNGCGNGSRHSSCRCDLCVALWWWCLAVDGWPELVLPDT